MTKGSHPIQYWLCPLIGSTNTEINNFKKCIQINLMLNMLGLKEIHAEILAASVCGTNVTR